MASNYHLYGDDLDDMGRGDAGGKDTLQQPQKSSLVRVEIGSDRLPTSVELARSWKEAFDPLHYGRSIMDAYDYAVFELTMHYVDSATSPPSTLPTLREVTPLLLQTRTYEEYRDLYNRLYLEEVYTVHGPGSNEYDEPAMTVTATLSSLVSVDIDPSWAKKIEADFIAQDIIECFDQVRAKKPEWVRDVYLDQESEQELAARLIKHERQLLRNEF
ncbi:hypothetical protein LTT66_22145 [Nocardia gipuzkoensis]|uniref:hypothetical protein n=1 Tax=Nocardia gipuzkoensis TaxID=2749991 RepID=UPI001E4C103D|nr:hypothetical protein [Nocardia gipuzkoensis]UGT66007.1 hypothetical protein LTT66_22145 [Nocardia gipuzkoensis]